MMISTKGRYALRLMLDIALNQEKGPVKLIDVSKRQNISEKYLEQIVAMLNKAGYLVSIRGYQGGYRLKNNPNEYNVYDILVVTEGTMAPVECLSKGAKECPIRDKCVTIKIWEDLYGNIQKTLSKYTLTDLIGMAQIQNGSIDFII